MSPAALTLALLPCALALLVLARRLGLMAYRTYLALLSLPFAVAFGTVYYARDLYYMSDLPEWVPSLVVVLAIPLLWVALTLGAKRENE